MDLRKIIINAIGWSVAALSILTMAIACDIDDDAPVPTEHSIAVLLANGTTVTLFTEALEMVGYLDNLDGTAEYTVLAPSDDAFEAFLEDHGYEDLEDVPDETLQALVLNHLIPTHTLTASDLEDLNYVDSSAKYTLMIALDDDDIIINGTSKVDPEAYDVVASNGIIHRMEGVLDVLTVASFLERDAQFTDFYEGLTTLTPTLDFIETLETMEDEEDASAPFTLFVPNNEAFETLLDTNEDWEELEDIGESTLIAILKHHIVLADSVSKEDLEDDVESLETWEGDDLTFSESDDEITITDGSGNGDITIVTFDIKTQNGIIHGLGSVLIPDMEN